MRTNMDVLRGKMVEKRIDACDMAQQIGISTSTFYRKLKSEGETFTVGQMHEIVSILKLSDEDARKIFLW